MPAGNIPEPVLHMLELVDVELQAATNLITSHQETGKRLGPRERERVFRLLSGVSSKAEQLKVWLRDS